MFGDVRSKLVIEEISILLLHIIHFATRIERIVFVLVQDIDSHEGR